MVLPYFWLYKIALANFFEDDNTVEESIAVDNDDTENAPLSSAGGAATGMAIDKAAGGGDTERQKTDKAKAAESRPRIATIHNMTKSSSEDEDEQGQAFYTGTARSGQQILGPPKKNPIKDYVSEVFRSAQESGAEVVEQPHTSSGGPR